jgi:hypothetical protein
MGTREGERLLRRCAGGQPPPRPRAAGAQAQRRWRCKLDNGMRRRSGERTAMARSTSQRGGEEKAMA